MSKTHYSVRIYSILLKSQYHSLRYCIMKSRKHTRTKPITAELIEMTCEKCKHGVFRFDSTAEVIEPYATKQYPHRCSHCNDQVYIASPFPIIKFRNETWVLEKNVS